MTLMFVFVLSRWKLPAGTEIRLRGNDRVFGKTAFTVPEFAGFVVVAPTTVKKSFATPVKV